MKLLVDVNLSPGWVQKLSDGGHSAAHWSDCGDPRATDAVILDWARRHGWVVVTADLDFGTLLALTRDAGPSVVQIRGQAVLPQDIGELVLRVVDAHAGALEEGALVTVDATGSRVRILPIRR